VSALVDDGLHRRAVAWRHHLHAHPELSFAEVETASFVEARLLELPGLVVERPTPTSVVGRLTGGGPGRTIALRADMDALAVREETGLPYASTRHGVMHACGHDGHTAMLLAAATVLAARARDLAGEVRFVFQHAEERPPGGARELVAAGVLDGVDAVVGAHLWAHLPTGAVAVREGPVLAAADEFMLAIRGRGGHGALPHRTVDPIAVGAQVVTNLQHVVARTTDPLDDAVVSVTQFHGGTANNVIPEQAELAGTARSFRPEVRDALRETIGRIARGVAAAHGATCEVDYREGYAPVVNDPVWANTVASAASRSPGVTVAEMAPIMGGEDFSAYLAVVPGAFFFVGCSPDPASAFPHHHPRFVVDDGALRLGAEVLVRTALAALS
jgi:amidohydrolase